MNIRIEVCVEVCSNTSMKCSHHGVYHSTMISPRGRLVMRRHRERPTLIMEQVGTVQVGRQTSCPDHQRRRKNTLLELSNCSSQIDEVPPNCSFYPTPGEHKVVFSSNPGPKIGPLQVFRPRSSILCASIYFVCGSRHKGLDFRHMFSLIVILCRR